MDWSNYLFSFEGRINRAKYWLFVVVGMAATLIMVGILFALGRSIALFIILGIAYLAIIYMAVAVGAKRLHDRGKTAWWLLLFYLGPVVLDGAGRASDAHTMSLIHLILSIVSFAVTIWGLIELGVLRGTDGPNQYGPDPLEGR